MRLILNLLQMQGLTFRVGLSCSVSGSVYQFVQLQQDYLSELIRLHFTAQNI